MSIADAALQAHCRRVAGWATEAARHLDFSHEELVSLERAALLHHYPVLVVRPETLTRVAAEMAIQITDDPRGSIQQTCLAILRALHGLPAEHPRVAELAKTLEWANHLDQEFELQALDPLPPDLEREFNDGAPQLRLADPDAVLRAGHMLPVFPTVAQRAMRLLTDNDAGFEHVERIVGSDQVLAAELMRAANTAAMGPRQHITTIRAAIAHVGVKTALRVITAACLQPVFASRRLYDLWNHSLEAAQVAEELATAVEGIDPGEAFLAGLVHDIGRLAFTLLSCEYQSRSQRLIEYGCPPVLVEHVLTGTNHAEAGALLLEEWALPRSLSDAVRGHHEPAQACGPLAAILHLTEFRTASDEDLPSRVKLNQALRVLKLPFETAVAMRPRKSPSLRHFRLAAAG